MVKGNKAYAKMHAACKKVGSPSYYARVYSTWTMRFYLKANMVITHKPFTEEKRRKAYAEADRIWRNYVHPY